MKFDYSTMNFCLYNDDTEQLIEGLHWEQFRALIKTIEEKGHPYWYFWHEGLERWQTIDQILDKVNESKGKRLRLTPLPPALPASLSNPSATAFDPNKDKIEQRTTKRYHRTVSVTLHIGNHTYSMETADISIGGARLSSPIPENFSGSFVVEIQTDKGPLELEAVLIENTASGARIKFIPTEDLEELRDFLLGV